MLKVITCFVSFRQISWIKAAAVIGFYTSPHVLASQNLGYDHQHGQDKVHPHELQDLVLGLGDALRLNIVVYVAYHFVFVNSSSQIRFAFVFRQFEILLSLSEAVSFLKLNR